MLNYIEDQNLKKKKPIKARQNILGFISAKIVLFSFYFCYWTIFILSYYIDHKLSCFFVSISLSFFFSFVFIQFVIFIIIIVVCVGDHAETDPHNVYRQYLYKSLSEKEKKPNYLTINGANQRSHTLNEYYISPLKMNETCTHHHLCEVWELFFRFFFVNKKEKGYMPTSQDFPLLIPFKIRTVLEWNHNDFLFLLFDLCNHLYIYTQHICLSKIFCSNSEIVCRA